MMTKIRKPAVAGMFYPANKSRLEEELDLLNSMVPVNELNDIFGIVVPHAGYIYSGKTAAYAYKLLVDKTIKNIFIVSPSHREYFNGISVYDGDAYETPLGVVPVNSSLAQKLTEGSEFIKLSSQGQMQEHAVEVQIPFLQKILNDFQIIPIVMGDQSSLLIEELAKSLAKVVDNESIVIASSDLSHYYSKAEAFEKDSIVEEKIKQFDIEGLLNSIDTGKCEACGAGPILVLLKSAQLKGYNKAEVLNRSDSGDITGDHNEVVGYLSAVIYNG